MSADTSRRFLKFTPERKTGLVGGEVLSMEAIVEAVRAGYVPVYAVDERTRQQRRRDELTRQPVKPMRARTKSDKLKRLLGHE